VTTGGDVAARIDAYIATAPDVMREHLRRMREVLQSAAPEAVEWFGYGLPGFKYLGRALLYYGATSKHYALYGNTEPAVAALQEDLKGLDISKGTIRFRPGDPFPEALLHKLVEVRVAETEAAEAVRKAKARAGRKRS
jgi:uncharacterized protein YdhG (YjbR/CyaY superfamily)